MRLVLYCFIGANLYLFTRGLDPLIAAFIWPEQFGPMFNATSGHPRGEQFFFSCLVFPLAEEFIFRKKMVLWIGGSIGRRRALFVSGLLFIGAHFEYYGSPYMINMALLAACGHALFEHVGLLHAPFLAHATLNFCVLLPKPSMAETLRNLKVPDYVSVTLVLFAWTVVWGALLAWQLWRICNNAAHDNSIGK